MLLIDTSNYNWQQTRYRWHFNPNTVVSKLLKQLVIGWVICFQETYKYSTRTSRFLHNVESLMTTKLQQKSNKSPNLHYKLQDENERESKTQLEEKSLTERPVPLDKGSMWVWEYNESFILCNQYIYVQVWIVSAKSSVNGSLCQSRLHSVQ